MSNYTRWGCTLKGKKITLLSILMNVFLVIALVLVVYKTGLLRRVMNQESYSNPQYEQRLTLFEQLETSDADVVFIGDSLTERGLWNEMFTDLNIVNRGIGSDTSQGVVERLDNVLRLNPQKVFLNIGVNDLSLNIDREETLSNFQSIIDRVDAELPESEFYIQSILPVRDNYALVNNDDINELNSHIEQLAENNGLIYIDIASSLKNEEGSLISHYTADGIHLTGDAYVVWAELLNEYIN